MKRALFLLVSVVAALAWGWVFAHPANPPPTPPSPIFIGGFSVFLGVACGVIAALVAMVVRALVTPRPALALADDEHALVAAPANHWQGVEARGGRLLLTTHAVVFVPHRFNMQREIVRIAYGDIAGLGAGPESLEVRPHEGKVERVRVAHGEALVDQLAQLAAAPPDVRACAVQTGLVRAPWLQVEGDPRVLEA
jgi:hypothetical protein